MLINRFVRSMNCGSKSGMRTFLFFIGWGGIFSYYMNLGLRFYHPPFGLYRRLFEYIHNFLLYIVDFLNISSIYPKKKAWREEFDPLHTKLSTYPSLLLAIRSILSSITPVPIATQSIGFSATKIGTFNSSASSISIP